MITSEDKKQFWIEFLELYRDLPALWNIKSDEYKKRGLKDEGYENMVEKLQEIDPEATRTSVTRKINSLRVTYRRELKKVLSAEMLGQHYTPKLYYFEAMSFIRTLETDQEFGSFNSTSEDGNDGTGNLRFNGDVGSMLKLEIENEETELIPRPRRIIKKKKYSEYAYNDQDKVSDEDTDTADTTSPIKTGTRLSHPWKKRKTTDGENTSYEDILNSLSVSPNSYSNLQQRNNSYYVENNDPINVLGKCWAQEFYNLSTEQQIYARKGINDILFEGRLGTLHRHSIKINENEEITTPISLKPTKHIKNADASNNTIRSIITMPDDNNFRICTIREENKTTFEKVKRPVEQSSISEGIKNINDQGETNLKQNSISEINRNVNDEVENVIVKVDT